MTTKKWGVTITITQNLSSFVFLISNISCEILWIQFKTCKGQQYLVGSNAAECTPLEKLDMSLHILHTKFICGLWETAQNCLIVIVHDHRLHQLVNYPTGGTNIFRPLFNKQPVYCDKY